VKFLFSPGEDFLPAETTARREALSRVVSIVFYFDYLDYKD